MMKHLLSYERTEIWKQIQNFLPPENRINRDNKPEEKYRDWQGNNIHIDHYPASESSLKVILLHGVGGNGRLLSFAGVPIHRAGYEVISPDLPGYGLTVLKNKKFTFDMWVNMVVDLISAEKEKDNRPVVLFGLSAGGMLAYQAACMHKDVAGVIATCILDQRIKQVRMTTAINPFMGMISIPLLKLSNNLVPGLRMPMKLVAKMSSIVNNKDFLKILIKDPASSGVRVPVSFLHSLMTTVPAIEPENFRQCPFLLVHPENDLWTPVELSRLFYDRLACEKKLVILEKSGHFPIEEPGISQMNEAVISFLERVESQGGHNEN